jgi:threonyl-tRNA synthetase
MNDASQKQAAQELMRHSMAHILAMAIIRLYPNTKIGIGPAIENGFYYEVDAPIKLTMKDLPKIEAEMRKIIAEELPFKQIIIPKEQAFDTLMQSGQIFKTELLRQIPDESVSFYKTGDFYDLCRGPHLAHTGQAGFFKLTRISSSHWLGEKNRPKLQRVEGVAFTQEQDLITYLESQKEIVQKDYRKIGRRLNLITFDDDIGNNLMIWLPKGDIIREELKKFLFDKLAKLGIIKLSTPSLAKFTLYRDYFEDSKIRDQYLALIKTNRNEYLFRNDSFFHHAVVFKSTKKSYRQMPQRYAEYFDLYKQNPAEAPMDIEYSQTLQTNIFCRNDQIEEEIETLLGLTTQLLNFIGVKDYQILVKLSDPKLKSNKDINPKQSLKLLEKTLAKQKLAAKIIASDYYNNGAEIGFYVKDLLGNMMKISSLRIDRVSAGKEELYYINNDNLKEIPVVIRFNFVESFESLLKIMLEKNEGIFDVWLAPIQCVIIAISEKYHEQALSIQKQLLNVGLRASVNLEPETMQNKIRRAENENIPYMLILGEKEVNTNSVSLRQRTGQELGLIRIEEFIDRIKDEISQKAF